MLQDFKSEIKLFLIVAAISAVLAVGGVLLLKAMQPAVPAAGPAPAAQTPPPMPEPQPQALEGWQTYRNPKYQFEIRYPREFEVSIAGPIKYSPDRVNFRVIDICEKDNYPYPTSDRMMVIGEHEAILHFSSFSSPLGYIYDYEIKKDNCTSLIFTLGSSELDEPTATSKPTPAQKELFEQIISTLRFVEENEAAQWTDCVDEHGGIPVITSVSPDSGPIGTEIEIRGCDFFGFEGDLNAWIENEQGVSGILYGREDSTSKLIKTTIGSSYCQTDNSYSGLPCEKWLTITPGTYKIYVIPWGQRSNEVTFMVTPEQETLGDAATREECLRKYGVWQKWGLAQLEYCQIPARDAGESCTDQSQCTYGCISETGTVPGKCAAYKNTFGCFSIVNNGRVEQALCVD